MKQLAVVFSALLLSACATTKFESVNLNPAEIVRAKRSHDLELKNIAVVIAAEPTRTGQVMVQADYLALWKDSLQHSIDKAGLFKDDVERKVNIEAQIKKFEFNPTGFSNKVDVEVTYRVLSRATGEAIFEVTTVSSASGSAKETWDANQRLIKLWNLTTQESISRFIVALGDAKL